MHGTITPDSAVSTENQHHHKDQSDPLTLAGPTLLAVHTLVTLDLFGQERRAVQDVGADA